MELRRAQVDAALGGDAAGDAGGIQTERKEWNSAPNRRRLALGPGSAMPQGARKRGRQKDAGRAAVTARANATPTIDDETKRTSRQGRMELILLSDGPAHTLWRLLLALAARMLGSREDNAKVEPVFPRGQSNRRSLM